MGTSASWVAVKGKSVDQVRTELKLRATGQTEPFPEAECSDVLLASGWHVVVSFRSPELCDERLLQRLSASSEAVGCFFEEHVMFSSASHWIDGRRQWSATADSQRETLELEGVKPSVLTPIQERLTQDMLDVGEEQEDVTVDYAIPLELAKAVTGFAFDDVRDDEESNPYHVLESTTATKTSWWHRLLGRQ